MIFGAAAKRYAATFRGKTFDSSSDVEGYLTKLFSSAMKEAADCQSARIGALEAENSRLRSELGRVYDFLDNEIGAPNAIELDIRRAAAKQRERQ